MLDLNELAMANINAKNALRAHLTNSFDLAVAKNRSEKEIALAVADGRISGKNETERKAQAFTLFSNLYEIVDQFETKVAKSNIDNELAKLDLQFQRDCIRIAELAKK